MDQEPNFTNQAPTHIYIHTYIHTYVHTYIHAYIYIHTCIHTYIHTYIKVIWSVGMNQRRGHGAGKGDLFDPSAGDDG